MIFIVSPMPAWFFHLGHQVVVRRKYFLYNGCGTRPFDATTMLFAILGLTTSGRVFAESFWYSSCDISIKRLCFCRRKPTLAFGEHVFMRAMSPGEVLGSERCSRSASSPSGTFKCASVSLSSSILFRQFGRQRVHVFQLFSCGY